MSRSAALWSAASAARSIGGVVGGPVGAVIGGAIGAASGATAGLIDEADADPDIVVEHEERRG